MTKTMPWAFFPEKKGLRGSSLNTQSGSAGAENTTGFTRGVAPLMLRCKTMLAQDSRLGSSFHGFVTRPMAFNEGQNDGVKSVGPGTHDGEGGLSNDRRSPGQRPVRIG